MSDLSAYKLTATEASSLLKSNKLSVEEYAKSCLERISSRDAEIRAWVYLDPDLVLKQARALDAVPFEKRGPLHGIPIAIKDVIMTKDMPTRYFSPLFENDGHTNVDAAAVQTLRQAGALIFGKVHTTELASVYVGGPCRNPHDVNRTPGGSSSGSAAAVADFHVPIALGTQTAGSVIRPGSFNGTISYKGTWGSISREGLVFSSATLDTLGFFTRNVEDLDLISEVFKLADDEPISGFDFNIKGAQIALCKTSQWHLAGEGTRKAMQSAFNLLNNAGAQVSEIELPEEFSKVPSWQATVMATDARTGFLHLYNQNKDLIEPGLADRIANNANITRKEQLDAYDGPARLRPVIDEILGRYDIIITPSATDEAPVGLKNTGDSGFCIMWTILGVPVINVPGFQGSNGMPIGLSLVAPRYRDLHLIHAAKAVEKVFSV